MTTTNQSQPGKYGTKKGALEPATAVALICALTSAAISAIPEDTPDQSTPKKRWNVGFGGFGGRPDQAALQQAFYLPEEPRRLKRGGGGDDIAILMRALQGMTSGWSGNQSGSTLAAKQGAGGYGTAAQSLPNF